MKILISQFNFSRYSGIMLSVLLFAALLLATGNVNSQSYTWRQVPNSIYSFTPFEDVSFVDSFNGWTILSNGSIYWSTDGGFNWQLTATIPSSISGVAFLNAQSGWVSSKNNVLHVTTDGGSSFSLVTNFPSPAPSGLQCINVLNGSILYGCGRETSDPVFVRSNDLGTTWITRSLSQFATGLTDCLFLNESRGFIAGSIQVAGFFRTVVLVTTDGGSSWSLSYQGNRDNEQGRRIDFVDSQTGYIALERVGSPERFFLKTTNGGSTWLEMPFPSYNETSIGFINGMTGWIGGFYNPLMGTTDGGSSWFNANIGQNIMEIILFCDTLGYACGNYIYRYDKTNGIASVGTVAPQEFELQQNYPNPFNPVTAIAFSVPEACNVTLEVFDVTGRKHLSYRSALLQPGKYEYRFDGSNLSSGIFIYAITAGQYSGSKAMVLVK